MENSQHNAVKKLIDNIVKSIKFVDIPGLLIFAVDKNKKVAYINEKVCNVLGCTMENIVGKNWFENFIYDQDKKKSEQIFESVIQGNLQRETEEYFLNCKDNNKKCIVRWYKEVLSDETGYIGVIYVGEDVTKRRNTQLELRHRIAMEQLINEISSTFLNVTPETVDEKILDTLANIGVFANADRCSVILYNEEIDELHSEYEWSAKSAKSFKNYMQSISGKNFPWISRKFIKREVLNVRISEMSEESGKIRDFLQSFNVKSVILMPMFHRGRFFGILGFDSETKEMVWGEQDIKLLQTIGVLLVNVIVNKKIQEEKRKAEIQLNIFKKLIETSDSGFIMCDDKGYINYVNPAIKRLLELKPNDEIIGKKLRSFYPKKYYDIIKKEILPLLLKEEQWIGEIPLLTSNQKEIETFQNIFTISGDDDKLDYIAGVISDITEQKKGEIALDESEKRFNDLANKFPLPFSISNPKGKILYLNPKFIEIFGYTLEEIPNIYEWMKKAYPDEEYRKDVEKYWEKVKINKTNVRANDVFCKDGTIKSIIFREFELNSNELIAIVELIPKNENKK